MTNKKQLLHIAMRIGSYQERALRIGVIESHNELVRRWGKALFGKAGRTLSADRLRAAQNARGAGVASKLIVIQRQNDKYVCHAAPILSLPPVPFQPDLRLVPSYYHDLVKEIRLWVEIGMLVPVDEAFLRTLQLASNRRPLVATLDSCRTSLMLVSEGKSK